MTHLKADEATKHLLKLSWEPDYSSLQPQPPAPIAPFSAWATAAVCAARKRAKIKKWRFNLTANWVRAQIKAQDYRCVLSGVPFSDIKLGSSWKRPWRPSIDRIDSDGGYTTDNVRLVCVAVNTLLHDWGDGVFHEIIKAHESK